jgi:hypothetical protein
MGSLTTTKKDPGGGELLIRLQSHSMSAGLIIRRGSVVRTAPILKFMRGWPSWRVYTYAKTRNWQLEEVEGPRPKGPSCLS